MTYLLPQIDMSQDLPICKINVLLCIHDCWPGPSRPKQRMQLVTYGWKILEGFPLFYWGLAFLPSFFRLVKVVGVNALHQQKMPKDPHIGNHL